MTAVLKIIVQVIKLMKTHPPRAVEYKKTLTGVEQIDVELQKVHNLYVYDAAAFVLIQNTLEPIETY